jgi:carbonic anhydrase/acetyltransferase-like protein (isoleucine patch superfamily)
LPGVELGQGAWIAPGSTVVGDVSLATDSTVMFQTLVDGTHAPVTVDEAANIQDNCVVQSTPGHPVHIGARVSLGHNATLIGAVIEEDSLLAINATVHEGAVIGSRSIVAANAVVPAGTIIPPGSLVMGNGRVVRPTREGEIERVLRGAAAYVRLNGGYRATLG